MTERVVEGYGPNTYFAFVESSDPVGELSIGENELVSDPFEKVLSRRLEFDLPPPTKLLWLDCVRANYLLSLDWTSESVDSSDPRSRERRRSQIHKMDSEEFRVAHLPVSNRDKGEAEELAEYESSNWHLISILDQGERPALVGPDFDIVQEGGRLQYVEHHRTATKTELLMLHRVFNLDFIEEMQFDGRENPGPSRVTPPKLPAGGGEEKEIDYERQESRILQSMGSDE